MRISATLFHLLAAGGAICAAPAFAQDSDSGAADEEDIVEDAVASANDAFGRTVGYETTGLYTTGEVRGFDPISAGNARIEGLYFDQISRMSARLIRGNSIRVGYNALGYPFPAPSGLVDYSINKPAQEPSAVLEAETDLNAGTGGSLEASLPIRGTNAAFFAGAGFFGRNYAYGDKAVVGNYAGVFEWRPSATSEIIAFGSGQYRGKAEPQPNILVGGDYLPPEIERERNLAQPWAESEYLTQAWGLIAKMPLAGMRLETGVFYAHHNDFSWFSDQMAGVTPDGAVGQRFIITRADQKEGSLSGEMRLIKPLDPRNMLMLSVRGRDRTRQFGGAQRIDLGPSTLLERDIRERPEINVGEPNDDDVRQLTVGLAYSGMLGDAITLDAGIMRTSYRKEVTFADPAAPVVLTEDTPILWNAAISYTFLEDFTAFASIVRGMEEALTAPDRAVNRFEAPAAVHTKQEEVGLRFSPSPELTMLLGAFRISRPYHNLDEDLFFRLLGNLNIKGVEFSLRANPAPGITILGGAVLADPKIEGEAVDTGLIEERPISTVGNRAIANVDWRPDAGQSAWSFDLGFEHVGDRAVNAANTLFVPQYNRFDLGFRFRTELGGQSVVFRGKIDNLFDNYGWNVGRSGSLTYRDARKFTLRMTMDL